MQSDFLHEELAAQKREEYYQEAAQARQILSLAKTREGKKKNGYSIRLALERIGLL